jgi:hypothetical protein
LTPATRRRLLGGDYTEDDVREILDSLSSVLKADQRKELEHAAHTHVLVLSQLFKQAEGMGLNFSVDTSELENQSLLSEMKQFEEDTNERKATEAKMSVSRGPTLATLSKAGDAAGHLDLVRKNNELEDEVRQWKQRFESLKEQSLGMARAHSALGGEREALAQQFEAMSMEQQQAMMQMQQQQQELGQAKEGANAALTMSQQLEAANSDLRVTQEELEMYKQMQGEKVDQSKQFQQLKKVGAPPTARERERAGPHSAEGRAWPLPLASSQSSSFMPGCMHATNLLCADCRRFADGGDEERAAEGRSCAAGEVRDR